MCLCACHCCSRFCGLLLYITHATCTASGLIALGYCIGKSNEGIALAAAVALVGIVGMHAASSGGERRTCALLLHIVLSFAFAVVLTVLGCLVLVDVAAVTKHISAEAIDEYLQENNKFVGYVVLIAAGAYYVLAFLSWGYRNQINSLDDESGAEERESLLEDQPSRHSKTDAARERLSARYGQLGRPQSDALSVSSRNGFDSFEMQESRPAPTKSAFVNF